MQVFIFMGMASQKSKPRSNQELTKKNNQKWARFNQEKTKKIH